MKSDVDMLVVGGGINGVGIARDAAGRGLSVLLCEKDDLASHTSSTSTKLIHGGLRYLEYYEFRLVRKALQEREVLLRAAPHIISPLRFVMPHVPRLRPAWMIRLGLFLYDNLSHSKILFGSRGINLKTHVTGSPLQTNLTKGFLYSDAWVDDARLVVLNAMGARELGATILTRTKLIAAQPDTNGWQAHLFTHDQQNINIHARCIVNAAGPWAGSLLSQQIHMPRPHPHRDLRLIKGSHIVTKKLFNHHYAYIFQNPDHRIIFAIPYLDQYTLIGTTELEFQGNLDQVSITEEEISYLCDAINSYFKRSITPDDVVWSYSGVRPLLEHEHSDNPTEISRDYQLSIESTREQALLLSIFGGKITTYRRLAEEALDLLTPFMGIPRPAWTAKAALPGGDFMQANFKRFLIAFRREYAWLPEALAYRYAHNYGSRVRQMLKGCTRMESLGKELSPGLFEQEAHYLVEHEWARQADDILWRRTKLGLQATPESRQRLEEWLGPSKS